MAYKKIVLIALCLIISGSASAEVKDKNNGTITGTIKARGVRDARDVVVSLEKVEGTFKPSEERPVLDQKNLAFVPHVLPVLIGTTVEFPNNDNVRHNVLSPSKTKKFNLGTYAGGVSPEVVFDKAGVVALLCNVHQEMSAFVVILENPYFAVTGPDGTFTIKDVPPGTYQIKTWHEKLKEKTQEITVAGGESVAVDFKISR